MFRRTVVYAFVYLLLSIFTTGIALGAVWNLCVGHAISSLMSVAVLPSTMSLWQALGVATVVALLFNHGSMRRIFSEAEDAKKQRDALEIESESLLLKGFCLVVLAVGARILVH